jgi:hypothetical protein
MVSIKARADAFGKEAQRNREKIKRLETEGEQARVASFVADKEFPSISEVEEAPDACTDKR